MARGRMIDKVIILSKKINTISEGAENLYYRIYVNTDDFGLFHADPKILKGQIYTLRNISIATIEKRLNELIEIGLIKVYENTGERYLEIIGFEKHQTFRKDYKRKHEYPSPSTKSYGAVRSRTESPTKLNQIKLNQIKINKSKVSESELLDLCTKIVSYLNEKANKKFSPKTENTIKLIKVRTDDGYKLKDFKYVIDVKVSRWKDNPEWDHLLRPETLFCQKHFESYLNEKILCQKEPELWTGPKKKKEVDPF